MVRNRNPDYYWKGGMNLLGCSDEISGCWLRIDLHMCRVAWKGTKTGCSSVCDQQDPVWDVGEFWLNEQQNEWSTTDGRWKMVLIFAPIKGWTVSNKMTRGKRDRLRVWYWRWEESIRGTEKDLWTGGWYQWQQLWCNWHVARIVVSLALSPPCVLLRYPW